jgi:hypothetical protein
MFRRYRFKAACFRDDPWMCATKGSKRSSVRDGFCFWRKDVNLIISNAAESPRVDPLP